MIIDLILALAIIAGLFVIAIVLLTAIKDIWDWYKTDND